MSCASDGSIAPQAFAGEVADDAAKEKLLLIIRQLRKERHRSEARLTELGGKALDKIEQDVAHELRKQNEVLDELVKVEKKKKKASRRRVEAENRELRHAQDFLRKKVKALEIELQRRNDAMYEVSGAERRKYELIRRRVERREAEHEDLRAAQESLAAQVRALEKEYQEAQMKADVDKAEVASNETGVGLASPAGATK